MVTKLGKRREKWNFLAIKCLVDHKNHKVRD